MVAPLGEGEANGAAGAAVHHLVLHPVVGRRAARLVAHRPAEDPAAPVAHQDLAVVPEERRESGLQTSERRTRRIKRMPGEDARLRLLLGDGERRDLGRLGVVLAVERRVHGEFAPEDQLALPPVA